MTREFIERHQGILADIAAIKVDKVTDMVQGSSTQFPWGFCQGIPCHPLDAFTKSTKGGKER